MTTLARRLPAVLLLTVVLALSAFAVPALAATSPSSADGPGLAQGVEPSLFPVNDFHGTPPGFSVSPRQAVAIAETSPTAIAIHRRDHHLQYVVYVWLGSHYEIYFASHGTVVADVLVGAKGHLGSTFTGPLIFGLYARGHYSPFFDHWYVWAPFALLFLLPFVPWRRRRLGLRHLDVLALLSFGASYLLFDAAHLQAAVWAFYPPLLYLLARMLRLGFRPDKLRRELDGGLPLWMLAGGLLLMVAARISFALLPVNGVMDVGYASEIGAWHILHGQPIYYPALDHPDTYGPIAYLAYAPFEAIWPWHGLWNYLTAARAASISFDTLTMLGLFLLGRQLRGGRPGTRLGLLLAWGWAANPFTLLSITKSTNDSLLAMLIVFALLALSRPIVRGALVGLAAAAKFFPAVLLPLFAAGHGERDRSRASRTIAACLIVSVGSVAIFLPPGGISEFWSHTLGFQLSRTDIFSIWALHPTLGPAKDLVTAGALGIALLVALRPRGPRTVPQVAALAAAVTIALQLPAVHWFYFYIEWFLPFVLVALLALESRTTEGPVVAEPAAPTELTAPLPAVDRREPVGVA
ncbi:MAG TPA: glycosyltransferase 87 family protein [Solirubrobacteraceae bacterium]|jgi:hypothetical protein|nr:glycosyltransferase 87 family protein [Solirubrobacteraceae bacterium]